MSKTLWRGAHARPVLVDVSLDVRPGELVALHGERRAGKTTLLRIATGLLLPDAGVVRVEGVDVGRLSERQHAQLLADRLGWASCADDPPCDLRALEHVATPLLRVEGRRAAERRAAEALALVGAERCARTPWSRLADVERTLVTLARALARRPRLLLVDDATVGLSAEDRERVVELLREQAESAGLGILMGIGERPAPRRAHRVWRLHGGRLTAPSPPPEGGGRVIRLPLGR